MKDIDTHAVYPPRREVYDHPGCVLALIAICFVLALLALIWMASLF